MRRRGVCKSKVVLVWVGKCWLSVPFVEVLRESGVVSGGSAGV